MKRQFRGDRLYRLINILVIAISFLCGLYAIWAYYQIESNSILHTWQDYCNKNPYSGPLEKVGYTCMQPGFQQINMITNLMFITGVIAIILPTVFYGGSKLISYLFPIKTIK